MRNFFFQELHLQANKLNHLKQCEKYLPTSLEVLSLAKNHIVDLNEICSLVHLGNLNSITLSRKCRIFNCANFTLIFIAFR